MANLPARAFARRVFVGAVVVVTTAAVVWLAGQVIHVLLALFAGVLMAVFLVHLYRLVARWTGLSDRIAFALVVLVLLAVSVGGAIGMGSRIVSQSTELTGLLPEAWAQFQQRLEDHPWGRTLLNQLDQLEGGSTSGFQLVRAAGNYASVTLGILASVVVILFVGLYLAYEPGVYVEGAVQLVPPRHRARMREVLQTLGHTLWNWLIGRFIGMAIVWALTTIGLALIGVPLALTLGFLAGLLNFIPNIGPIVSVVPAALLALSQGTVQVVYVILLFTAVQLVESYVITPQVQKHMVSLPPALTISAQLLMGVLLGFMGLLLATPLCAAALVLVRMLYVGELGGDEKASERLSVCVTSVDTERPI